MLFTTNPVLEIEVECVKSRALIDTWAGSSNAFSNLINKINKKPIRRESKRIQTLMHSVAKKTKINQFEIGDVNQGFKMDI